MTETASDTSSCAPSGDGGMIPLDAARLGEVAGLPGAFGQPPLRDVERLREAAG